VGHGAAGDQGIRMADAEHLLVNGLAAGRTDHASHKEQASMIRRYIIWRNYHAYDERLRRIIDRQT
jgi:hypothetical protein